MSSSDNTPLGDRMKSYESVETSRKAMKGLPLLARLDGRSFHNYTAGLKRPFDPQLTECMIKTAAFLLAETCAITVYTQSDEISLLWYFENESRSEFMFDGKFQKLTSVLAALASAKFGKLAAELLPSKAELLPVFDCRVWQVPTTAEAANAFRWRELDATKNAISMAASTFFSHQQLHGITGNQKQEMMFAEHGVNFNDYPTSFKRGTYLKRVNKLEKLDPELAKLSGQTGEVFISRNVVREMDWEMCTKLFNYEELLFIRVLPEDYKNLQIIKETCA